MGKANDLGLKKTVEDAIAYLAGPHGPLYTRAELEAVSRRYMSDLAKVYGNRTSVSKRGNITVVEIMSECQRSWQPEFDNKAKTLYIRWGADMKGQGKKRQRARAINAWLALIERGAWRASGADPKVSGSRPWLRGQRGC